MGFKELLRAGFSAIKSQAPEIMLSGGIVLYGLAIVTAAKSTPRYLQERDRAEIDKGEPLTAKEEAVMVVKEYRVPFMFYLMATANVVGSYNIQNRTIMTLTTGINTLAMAYNKKLSEFDDYRNVVIDQIGENKERKIANVVAQDTVDNVINSNSIIYETGNGDVIFMDAWTGVLFKSCQNAVDRAFLILEEDLKADDWVPIARLYEIWFERNRRDNPPIESNRYLGWSLEECSRNRRYGNVLIDHCIDSTYSNKLQQAVTVVRYRPQAPKDCDWRFWY